MLSVLCRAARPDLDRGGKEVPQQKLPAGTSEGTADCSPNGGRAMKPVKSLALCILACAALCCTIPAEAVGGHGGGGGGFGGGSHGGHFRLHGGSFNGHFGDHNGFGRRVGGSGFGYNGGYFGQGTYLPYGYGSCLSRVEGPFGPRFMRTC